MHLGADDRADRQSATTSRNGRPPIFSFSRTSGQGGRVSATTGVVYNRWLWRFVLSA